MAKTKTLDQLRAEKNKLKLSFFRNSTSSKGWNRGRNTMRKANARNAPTAFAIWAAWWKALPRRLRT